MKARAYLYLILSMTFVGCQRDSSTKEIAPNYTLVSIDEGPFSLQYDGIPIAGPGITAYSIQKDYILLQIKATKKAAYPAYSDYFVIKILSPSETHRGVNKDIDEYPIKADFDSAIKTLGINNPNWVAIKEE